MPVGPRRAQSGCGRIDYPSARFVADGDAWAEAGRRSVCCCQLAQRDDLLVISSRRQDPTGCGRLYLESADSFRCKAAAARRICDEVISEEHTMPRVASLLVPAIILVSVMVSAPVAARAGLLSRNTEIAASAMSSAMQGVATADPDEAKRLYNRWM